ncbi:MAG: DUF962 domain-containing protein [Pseudanabaena sp. RU_4_16]|nr:DUF962 domain-containing protein [Pseudanabaena sp. RU_4_16]
MKRSFSALLQWQWNGYSEAHQNKSNLIVHIFAVPLFIAAIFGIAIAIFRFSLLLGVISLTTIILSLALQKKGHSFEENQPPTFKGFWDFLLRLLAEQFITFPRFLFTGEWRRNFSRKHKSSRAI